MSPLNNKGINEMNELECLRALVARGTVNLAQIEAIFNATPVADGTYTVGLGVGSNGTITTKNGLITAVQQAS